MQFIKEPEKKIKVICETDICVSGGGCTGVFAAVRAARMGAKVVIIEKQNGFGGTACGGLVNIWHGLYDTAGKNQVIAGLTEEMIRRLETADSLEISDDNCCAYKFNPNDLKIELDRLVSEHKIEFFLHSMYAGVLTDGNEVTHVLLENKDGRSAIKANFYIDCTGDGDMARDLGLPKYYNRTTQPSTACFFLQGDTRNVPVGALIEKYGREFGLEDSWGWSHEVPFLQNITLRADCRVRNKKCDNAEDLTQAETEGRRQAGALVQLLRKYAFPNYSIASLCSHIGVRETAHYESRFKACELDLLTGRQYEGAVLNGTYRIDVHHNEDNGITFKYLDGTTCTIFGKDQTVKHGNWKKENHITAPDAFYYQVPLDILIQDKVSNFIAAGRMLNADEGAFGALRVMVNLNQLGEAAGVAAATALSENIFVTELDGKSVRKKLRIGGSAL